MTRSSDLRASRLPLPSNPWPSFILLGVSLLAVPLDLLAPGGGAHAALSVALALVVYLWCGHCFFLSLKQLQEDCFTDQLTGLRNRRALEKRMRTEFLVARLDGRPLALLLLDVDFLKVINDSGGHAAGDHALRMVSQSMRSVCRASDLPVRLGGDEFVILAPRTSAEEAATMARRIQDVLQSLGHDPLLPVAISASAGIATTEMKGCSDGRGLLALADGALYCAKRCGRNRLAIGRCPLPPLPPRNPWPP